MGWLVDWSDAQSHATMARRTKGSKKKEADEVREGRRQSRRQSTSCGQQDTTAAVQEYMRDAPGPVFSFRPVPIGWKAPHATQSGGRRTRLSQETSREGWRSLSMHEGEFARVGTFTSSCWVASPVLCTVSMYRVPAHLELAWTVLKCSDFKAGQGRNSFILPVSMARSCFRSCFFFLLFWLLL